MKSQTQDTNLYYLMGLDMIQDMLIQLTKNI